jgi:predicted O-methyltransferase YrrM
MYSAFQLAKKYSHYYLTASNSKGHGIHSPFVFELVTKVLNDRINYDDYATIEAVRKILLSSKTAVEVEDYGAGSAKGLKKTRTIQQIAATSLKKPKYSQLLYRLVKYFQPATMLELGTSLGITTAYLAAAKKNANVITMEGAPAVAAIAEENFKRLNLQNTRLIIGNFDNTLPLLVHEQQLLFDFVFIDGNHRKKPTISYFEQLLQKSTSQTVFIFDDIHWSREMEEAWEAIKKHSSVTLTIDLFFIGLVFLRREQKEKGHFVIRF